MFFIRATKGRESRESCCFEKHSKKPIDHVLHVHAFQQKGHGWAITHSITVHLTWTVGI